MSAESMLPTPINFFGLYSSLMKGERKNVAVNNSLVDTLIGLEGSIKYKYQNKGDVPTFGVGFTEAIFEIPEVKKKFPKVKEKFEKAKTNEKGEVFTEEEIEGVLNEVLKHNHRRLSSEEWYNGMTDEMQRSLLSYSYRTGLYSFLPTGKNTYSRHYHKKFVEAVKNNDLEGILDNMDASYNKFTKERIEIEKAMMVKGALKHPKLKREAEKLYPEYQKYFPILEAKIKANKKATTEK